MTSLEIEPVKPKPEIESPGLSEGQINTRLKHLRSEQQNLATKIAELEVELHEHNLVIGAIDKLEPSRKCFRLVGGILVERNVGEVLPAVSKNRDGILEITNQLREQLNKKGAELNEFIVKNKLHLKSGTTEEEQDSTNNSNKSSTGVLV